MGHIIQPLHSHKPGCYTPNPIVINLATTLVIAAVATVAAATATVTTHALPPTVLFLVSGACTRRAHSIATMSFMFLSKAHNMAQSCTSSQAQAHSKPIGPRFVHVVIAISMRIRVVARTIAHSISTVVARTIARTMSNTVVARTIAHSMSVMARAMANHTMLMAMASAVAHHSRFGFVTLFFLIVRLFVTRARVSSWFLVSISTIVIELFAFFFALFQMSTNKPFLLMMNCILMLQPVS